MNGNVTSIRPAPSAPMRGGVWTVDLSPVRGHERGGRRPCVVVSWDMFNFGPAGLLIVLPITTTGSHIRSHIPVLPPDGGLRQRSFILCDQVRTVSKERLSDRWGPVSTEIMTLVEDALRILLELLSSSFPVPADRGCLGN